jgi:tetratricopeptide (TPR) repeat protein
MRGIYDTFISFVEQFGHMRRCGVVFLAAGLALWVQATSAYAAQTTASGQRRTPAPVAAPAPAPIVAANDPTAQAYDQFLLAQRAEDDDDADGAIAAYKRAMSLDPKAADVVAALANLYMRQNRASDATTTAENALKIDDKNAEAHRVLGTIYASAAGSDDNTPSSPAAQAAQRDNLTKAVDHLEKSIANPAGIPNANTRAMLSRLYLRTEQYEKAIAILLDLVKQEPGWQEGALLLAQAYDESGHTDEAVGYLEMAAEGDPQLYPTLADYYGRQQRWKDAAQAYERALQGSPRSFDLRVGYGSALLNIGGADNTVRARDVLRDAVAARGTDQRALYLLAEAERLSGDLEASERTARRLVALNRNSPRAYVALAEALEERQQYQAVVESLGPAVNEFRSASNSAAALGALLPHLGFAYQQTGKFDNAIAVFEDARRLAPNDPVVAGYLIQAQLAGKKYMAAAQLAHSMREQHPDDLRLARLEAQALRLGGKADQGIAVLQDIVQQHGNEPAAYIALAQGYVDANRGPQAVKVLQDAQTRFPENALITFELGAVFDKQKKFPEAEAAFRQLISRDPANAPALNYLGYMLADRGERLDESVSLLERALKVEPDNGSYLDSLGWALYKQGKLEQALEQLKRASDQLAANSVIQDHYGDVLFKMARYDEAIEAWSRSLSGDGDSIDRGVIDKKIRSARQKLPRR